MNLCDSYMVVVLDDTAEWEDLTLYRHQCVVKGQHTIHISGAGDGLIWEDDTKGTQPPPRPMPRYYVEDEPSPAALGTKAWHVWDASFERCVAEFSEDYLPDAHRDALAYCESLNQGAQT